MQDLPLAKLLSCIDLTSLNDDDNEATISELVSRANAGVLGNFPAAVCVYSKFGAQVHRELNPSIKSAVVGLNFPSGHADRDANISFYQKINQSEIDEVDIVVSPALALSSRWEEYLDEVSLAREHLSKKTLKVIIESGALETDQQIEAAAKCAIVGGADFVKTSTGKTAVGYTPNALEIICDVVLEHYERSNKRVGIKTSGGIRTLEHLAEIVDIIERNLDNDWLNPSFFRIGASQLYQVIEAELLNE